LPIRLTPDVRAIDEIAATDALLWLGNAAAAAPYLTALRQSNSDVPLWLGPWGADPVLAERADTLEQVYWIGWLDERYDAWVEEMRVGGVPTTPLAYLTYRATEAAVATVRNAPRTPTTWRAQMYVIDERGASHPVAVEAR
jgi:hypothetical protein